MKGKNEVKKEDLLKKNQAIIKKQDEYIARQKIIFGNNQILKGYLEQYLGSRLESCALTDT